MVETGSVSGLDFILLLCFCFCFCFVFSGFMKENHGRGARRGGWVVGGRASSWIAYSAFSAF